MVRKVVEAQCGILFDDEAITRAGIPTSTILCPAFATSDFVVEPADLATGSPPSTIKQKKIQPTLHFFTEPKGKREALKQNANAAATEPTASEPSGIKPVQSVTESSAKVVFGAGTKTGLSGGSPGVSHSKDAKGKEKEAEKSRRSEESEASVATQSSTGTEIDAMQPIDDELTKDKLWWILEILPTNYTWQDGQGRWHSKWGYVLSCFTIGWSTLTDLPTINRLHLGRGRNIPDLHPNFHESVKERMESKELNYKPRATWTPKSEVYVS
jgi:hypothetical protein